MFGKTSWPNLSLGLLKKVMHLEKNATREKIFISKEYVFNSENLLLIIISFPFQLIKQLCDS